MRTIVFSFSFPHHGKYSSFHRLCDYLTDQKVVDHTLRIPDWLPAPIARRLSRWWTTYGEARLWRYYFSAEPVIFHYLRPENNLQLGWKWKKKHRFVLSCHQPTDKLAELKRDPQHAGFFRGLEVADVVVVLSSTEIAGYRQHAPSADIRYIPLGVDALFFQPNPAVARKPLVMTVGSWLRDYDCWGRTTQSMLASTTDLEFVVVANAAAEAKAKAALGADSSRVRFLRGISDEELRDLYQRARVLFLPLVDAVANNALLEAMASGVPVVTTDLPATREYLGEEAGVLVPGRDARNYVDAMVPLLNDEARWRAMSDAGVRRANEVFAWDKVAHQYRALYKSLG